MAVKSKATYYKKVVNHNDDIGYFLIYFTFACGMLLAWGALSIDKMAFYVTLSIVILTTIFYWFYSREVTFKKIEE